LVVATIPTLAEVHSKSKELVVMEARDLPEQAQMKGNSLLLHSDSAGTTYLYVEQQQGTRLAVFDVTDPAHITLAASATLPAEGVFDFVRCVGDNAELVYFRDGQKEGVLDMRKAKKPVLRSISVATDLRSAQPLGQSGLLAVNGSYKYVPAVARDYQIVDISAADPALLATVKKVKHVATNDDSGTTFFLGSDGLTVVRQISVETDYKSQMQPHGY
jgi:hypothetical protein